MYYQPSALVLFLLLLSVTFCEVTINLNDIDYNYPNTTLLNITNKDDSYFTIDLPFSVRFQQASYNRLYVCSNSFITFGGSSTAYRFLQSIPYPKLLIDAADNFAYDLLVTASSSNVTFYYRGKRSDTKYGGQLMWKVTFFAEPYQKFYINIISNSLQNAGTGISSVCTTYTCYQSFDATMTQRTGYFDCGGGCVNAITSSCQPTTHQYCGICSSIPTSCDQCLPGYAFTPTTSSCALCNNTSLMVFHNECHPAIHGCKTYSSPTVCQSCHANYTGNNCTVCNMGYFLYNIDSGGNDCGAVIPSCIQYTPLTPNCNNCSDNRRGDNCQECIIGTVMEDNKCLPCYAVCSQCGNQTDCLLCYNGQRIDCTVRMTFALGLGIAFGLIAGVAVAAGLLTFVVKLAMALRNRFRQTAPSHQHQIHHELSNSVIRIAPLEHPPHQDQLSSELCSICLGIGIDIVTPCRHYFHMDCLLVWYDKHKKCPNCNQLMTHFLAKCKQCDFYKIMTMPIDIHNPQTTCEQCVQAALMSKPLQEPDVIVS